jgi:hypothetical protein
MQTTRTYNIVILKHEHLQLEALSVIRWHNPSLLNSRKFEKSSFYWHPSELRSHHQAKDFSSDHVKFKFQDVLLYHDGLLYVLNSPAWLRIFEARHNVLAIGHFRFNKTMELVSWYYWWSKLWKYVKKIVESCDVCVRI